MTKRKMWELAQLKDQMALHALLLLRTSHNSMLMPLRAASSVPWAGLRTQHTQTSLMEQENPPWCSLFLKQKPPCSAFLKHSIKAEAFGKSWSSKARLQLVLCYVWLCLGATRGAAGAEGSSTSHATQAMGNPLHVFF